MKQLYEYIHFQMQDKFNYKVDMLVDLLNK